MQTFKEEFENRENFGIYIPGTKEIEATVFIKPAASVKYTDLINPDCRHQKKRRQTGRFTD